MNENQQQGWVKLHRKLLYNPIFTSKDPYLLQLWLYILLKVNHEDNKFLFNGEEMVIKKGSAIFGYNRIVFDLTSCSKETDPEFQKFKSLFRRRMKILENLQNVTLNSTNKFTVVSVVKWDRYQESDTQVTLKRHSSDTQTTPNKNVKNDKNNTNEQFEEFWKAYPRKIGKPKCKAIYCKLENHVEILAGLERYKLKWKRDHTEDKFIPHPATWLNQGRWTDELLTKTTGVGQLPAFKFVEPSVNEVQEKKRREAEFRFFNERYGAGNWLRFKGFGGAVVNKHVLTAQDLTDFVKDYQNKGQ